MMIRVVVLEWNGWKMLPVLLLCPPVMMTVSPVEAAHDLDMTPGS